ncbi:MAG: Type II secretion system protein C [Deltaproteobacteria bacterium ADurb.Bin510]|nr:MAG: Type II secretion system protein C [Deltaproteobacteria bacterium ADurb.Bin510]
MLNRYRFLGDLLIATILVWLVVGIVMSIVSLALYDYPEPNASAAVRPERSDAPATIEDYAVIRERDLMRLASKPLKSGGPSGEDARVSVADLGVILKGTIAGDDLFARAIVEEGGNQVLYKLGERIKGAEIVAIYRNKIILNVNGREQMLEVQDSASGPAQASPTPPTPGQALLAGTDTSVNQVMQDLDKYIGRARISPYFRGGEPYGFRISSVSRGSALYEVGVRSGDILRSVGGQPVRTPEDVNKAFAQFKGAATVAIEVERRGATQNIDVPVAEIIKGKS